MRNRKAFTLIELLIALAIVGILALVSTTNLVSWLNRSAAVGFQRELLSKSNDARTRAMGSNRQQRLFINLGTNSVTLQSGNSGTGSTVWTNVGDTLVGNRGAGLQSVVADLVPGTVSPPSTISFIYHPGGQVSSQDNAATIRPLVQARIRLTAENPADQATLRLFGWTSKARLEHGWP
ncbi:MAG: hypothetical protein H6Q84_227 [Deltaproteobacteria bacterium]|nr:hypothetical protein [Deltaproteobacteria bacterium]